MPIDRAQLASLTDFVDAHLVVDGCDHTRRYAVLWAHEHQVEWQELSRGLDEFGGFCDCEVVMNCDPDEIFG